MDDIFTRVDAAGTLILVLLWWEVRNLRTVIIDHEERLRSLEKTAKEAVRRIMPLLLVACIFVAAGCTRESESTASTSLRNRYAIEGMMDVPGAGPLPVSLTVTHDGTLETQSAATERASIDTAAIGQAVGQAVRSAIAAGGSGGFSFGSLPWTEILLALGIGAGGTAAASRLKKNRATSGSG